MKAELETLKNKMKLQTRSEVDHRNVCVVKMHRNVMKVCESLGRRILKMVMNK